MTARRDAQGRPMAFLVAWARLATLFPAGPAGKSGHMDASHAKGVFAFLADGTSPQRVEARAYVEADPVLATVRAVEWQPALGEPLEPPGPF